MTPTPTVERVARAIEDNIRAALPSVYVHSMDYEYAARAAIEALRLNDDDWLKRDIVSSYDDLEIFNDILARILIERAALGDQP